MVVKRTNNLKIIIIMIWNEINKNKTQLKLLTQYNWLSIIDSDSCHFKILNTRKETNKSVIYWINNFSIFCSIFNDILLINFVWFQNCRANVFLQVHFVGFPSFAGTLFTSSGNICPICHMLHGVGSYLRKILLDFIAGQVTYLVLCRAGISVWIPQGCRRLGSALVIRLALLQLYHFYIDWFW